MKSRKVFLEYMVQYFLDDKRVLETVAVNLDYIGLTTNEKNFFNKMKKENIIEATLNHGDLDQDTPWRENYKFESNKTVYSILDKNHKYNKRK